ncbi:MAG: WG repeat-containing protein [Chlorogloea purpurea SAG 13.99]|nr:WG repeat-containing protein [Chlorogloea purpurea SAG 13.99]
MLINEKWGYINREGQFIITLGFEEARKFAQGLATVRVNNLWGYINGDGEIAIKPQFYGAIEFSEELGAVVKGDLWGYIDRSVCFIIPPQYHTVENFVGGLAKVNRYFQSSYIARTGSPVASDDPGLKVNLERFPELILYKLLEPAFTHSRTFYPDLYKKRTLIDIVQQIGSIPFLQRPAGNQFPAS